MTEWMLTASDGRTVVMQLEVADTFWTRFVGLQFRGELPAGHALLITRCPSIHTFCMRFAIDVAFLDEQWRVVEISRNVRPWRVQIPHAKACAVVETTAGQLALTVGDIVQMTQRSSGTQSNTIESV